MPAAILSAIAWVFRKISLDRLAEFVLRKVLFSKYVLIEIALFVLLLLYFGALLRMVVFLFGQLDDIYVFFKNISNPSGNTNNEITVVAFAVLSVLGVFKAFWDVFNLYAPIFISLFLMLGAKIGISLLKNLRKSISNAFEFTKLG